MNIIIMISSVGVIELVVAVVIGNGTYRWLW